MMDKLEYIPVNAQPMIGGIQKIIERDEEQELNVTLTEEEQDEDDDEYYLYDEDPPPYDISEKLKEINSALSREIIPHGYEERQRRVIFRENPVDFEIPPTPNYSSEDEDDGYGDSTETSDDLPDHIVANSSECNKSDNSQIKIGPDFANKQKLSWDLSQLLEPANSPIKSNPNSVAEEINFLFQCFTKLSMQNSASQAMQAPVPETPNLSISPSVNENEPFLLDSQNFDQTLPVEQQSAIITDSLDLSKNSFEESSNDKHQQSQGNSEDGGELPNDLNSDSPQDIPGSSTDEQSKSEDVENLNAPLKPEQDVEETREMSKPAVILQTANELSENSPMIHHNSDDFKELPVEAKPNAPSPTCSTDGLQKMKEKCSTTQALLKWKRAMRQLHNVRQAKYGPVPPSRSVTPKSTTEIPIELENEASVDTIFSMPDTARPRTHKPTTDVRNNGQGKRRLLHTRSSASSPALFKDKRSTNFEETMVMASQGKFRMMKTEDFQSNGPKLTVNDPRFVKMAPSRPMTSASRRPENRAKITPISTQQIYQRSMTNNSVKSKTLTLGQYSSLYRPHSVNWNKEEPLEDMQRQRRLRGFSGTTYRLTPEQKAEKERKLKEIAQERQQKLEKAKQEKFKRKQEVEIAFKDWLRCKKLQEPNYKKPAIEDEEKGRNVTHQQIEKSSSPAFQDWLKRKKVQKLEELRIAEIKRKVEEKMLYIRKHEDNEKAFKKWLQTKSRESNLSSLRRKSSTAYHFGSMSKWRTDNYFANYR